MRSASMANQVLENIRFNIGGFLTVTWSRVGSRHDCHRRAAFHARLCHRPESEDVTGGALWVGVMLSLSFPRRFRYRA